MRQGWPMKFGYSNRPDDRLQELQVGCWIRLKIHYKTAVEGRSRVRKAEQAIHRQLKTAGIKRLEGEWFDMTADAAIEFIKQYLERQWRDAA
jgi:hypothetical protein